MRQLNRWYNDIHNGDNGPNLSTPSALTLKPSHLFHFLPLQSFVPLFSEARVPKLKGRRRNMKAILFLTLLASCCSLGLAQESGNFETAGGSSCKWKEMHYQGSETSLLLDCKCKNEEGDKTYSCEYFGDPSSCAKLKMQGAVERFYGGMAYYLSSKLPT